MFNNTNVNEIQTQVVEVTPQMAQGFLDNQISTNRKLKDSHIRNLERAMLEGRWMLNGEALKFNRDGKMLDGQHRCAAIIRSKVPQRMLIVKDVPQESFTTLDGGNKRNAADYLVGEPNANRVAAAARWMYFYLKGRPLVEAFGGAVFTQELVEVINAHPGLITSAAFCGKMRLGHQSLFSFLHYLYSKVIQGEWTQYDVDVFFQGLIDGKDLPSSSSCFMLREMFLRSKASKHHINRIHATALIIKALKYHLRGQEPKQVKFSNQEKFPTLD